MFTAPKIPLGGGRCIVGAGQGRCYCRFSGTRIVVPVVTPFEVCRVSDTILVGGGNVIYASCGRIFPLDPAFAPSLSQTGYAGTGLPCVVVGGGARTVELTVAQFPRPVVGLI